MNLKWLIHDKLNITFIDCCLNSKHIVTLLRLVWIVVVMTTIWIPTSTYFFFKQWTTKVRPYHSSGIEGYNHNVLSINDQKYAYVRTE